MSLRTCVRNVASSQFIVAMQQILQYDFIAYLRRTRHEFSKYGGCYDTARHLSSSVDFIHVGWAG